MTEDYYFWSHRLLVAKSAKQEGFDVYVATHIGEYLGKLLQEGFQVVPTIFSRNNQNLWTQTKALLELVKIFKQIKPDIAHNIALKAIVFGSIASWVTGVPKVINLVAGLGVVFTDESKKYKLISKIARFIAGVLFSRSDVLVIVQNLDDKREIQNMASKATIKLIRGSGVDIQKYFPTTEPIAPICVSLVARMLWHKGVGEFVEASRLLKSWGENLNMQLVGGLDYGNPACITEQQIFDWQSAGLISWLGHQKNIGKIWLESHIAVLPSYREGFPKSLLEAAACGRPIVAANTPGCREIVIEGYNGFLVPVRNAEALAKAIQKLAHDSKLRAKMGLCGRELVCEKFSNERVIEQTMKVYHELIPAIG